MALLSGLVIVAIIITVTGHEFLHYAVAKSLGIPAQFLNMTAVGIPQADVPNYPSEHLLAMNGVAPLISMIFFGMLGFVYLRLSKKKETILRYVISWIVLLNLPYVGLQLLLFATRVRFNGTGNDFAAIAGYFEVPIEVRAATSVFGFILLIFLLYLLRSVVEVEAHSNIEITRKNLPRFMLGVCAFGGSFLSVILGNLLLVKGDSIGMTIIVFGSLIFLLISFSVLIPWKSPFVKGAANKWILPGAVGSIALLPVGVIDGNDYAIFWLISTTVILGAVFFRTRNASNHSSVY